MASLRFLVRGHCCHQHWLSWSNCWRTVDAVLSARSPWSCGLHRTSEGTSRHLLTCVLSKDWTEGLLCARLCGRGWAQVDFGEQGSSGTTLYSYILCPPWPRAEAPGQLASGLELREPMHSWGTLCFCAAHDFSHEDAGISSGGHSSAPSARIPARDESCSCCCLLTAQCNRTLALGYCAQRSESAGSPDAGPESSNHTGLSKGAWPGVTQGLPWTAGHRS